MSAGKKVYAVFSWAAAAACMGVIFYMSAQPGDDSAAMSGAIMEFVTRVFNIEPSSLVIRKTAHALEFAGLALLLNNAVYATFKSRFNAPAAFAAAVQNNGYAYRQRGSGGRNSGGSCNLCGDKKDQ